MLLGAVIHAGWNIVAKKANGDARFTFFSGAIMAVVWGPLCIWLGWTVVPTWGALEWSLMAVSGLVHWLYFVCLLAGYRKSDLTVVYPVARGSGPLLSSGLAIVVFGEQLSALGLAGIAGVACGVFFIAGGPGVIPVLRGGVHDALAHQRLIAGLGWGALTGSLIAAYTVLDAWAIKVAMLSPILFDYWCNMLRLPLAAVPVLKAPAQAWALFKVQWRAAAVVAVFSPVAYVCVLYAITMAPVSHVAPAREVSMLFAALIGGHLLGEADRGMRVLGATFMACGVAALALG